jgi:hypothetical protein
MTRIDLPPWPWRLLAVFLTVMTGPQIVRSVIAMDPTAFRSWLGLIAISGLLFYAYGFRIGPRLFWAGFSIVFSIGLMISVGGLVGTAFWPPPGVILPRMYNPAVLTVGVVMALPLCLALFRLGGMLEPRGTPREYAGIFD